MAKRRGSKPVPTEPVKTADILRRVGQSATLADEVVGRGTERGAAPSTSLQVMYWIAGWGLYTEANGREPRTPEEVAEALGLNRATVYRWQATFRDLFPEYTTPAKLWALVHDQVPSDDPHVAAFQLGAAEL